MLLLFIYLFIILFKDVLNFKDVYEVGLRLLDNDLFLTWTMDQLNGIEYVRCLTFMTAY